jgi:REP element-mobilizing transposase RayT
VSCHEAFRNTSSSAATPACPAFSTNPTARYLHLVRETLLATGCKLHAYLLMTNYMHLLARMRPPTTPSPSHLI